MSSPVRNAMAGSSVSKLFRLMPDKEMLKIWLFFIAVYEVFGFKNPGRGELKMAQAVDDFGDGQKSFF